MPFDVTDPADLLALQSEINTDPAAVGYVPYLDATNTLLDLLNNPAHNPGSPTINRPIEELDIPDVAGAIVDAEYGALSEYGKVWVTMLINRPAEEALLPYRDKFLDLFNAQSTTRANVQALRVKLASRAETLFGVNTVITRPELIAARSYVPE